MLFSEVLIHSHIISWIAKPFTSQLIGPRLSPPAESAMACMRMWLEMHQVHWWFFPCHMVLSELLISCFGGVFGGVFGSIGVLNLCVRLVFGVLNLQYQIRGMVLRV